MKQFNFCLIPLLLLSVLSGCGSGEQNEPSATPSAAPAPFVLTPQYAPGGRLKVAPVSGANASGQFVHPFDNEKFTGNLLASVRAEDPDGLAIVGLSFNQSAELKYLCEPEDDCPQGVFSKTETNINPADYGVYVGPLTLGLWVLDDLGNQMLVDAVTLDWQLRRIDGLTTSRSSDGQSLEVNWQSSSELLRYNLVLAAESGVTTANYLSKAQGQAKLAVSGGPQTFTGLNADQQYFLQLTGVDGSGESAFSSELRLAVPSGLPNTPPVVQQESYSSPQNQALSGNVLLNDSDNENDQLSVSPLPIQFPQNGDLALNRDGSFIYTPTENFIGNDSFIYEVQDGQGGLSQGSVQINVDDINDPPTALRDAYATPVDQALNVTAPGILANDSDVEGDAISLLATPVENVQHGTLNLNTDGSFDYQPDSGFSGLDYFIYQIQDIHGLTANARVDIKVGDVNVPPVAVNDSYQLNEDGTLTVSATASDALLMNDYDLENDTLTLTASLVENVKNGVLTIDVNGNFTYLPNANFYGTDSFIYQITDGQDNFAEAMVLIEVLAVNDAPVALDDYYQINVNGSLNVMAPGVLSNDSDPDLDSLTVITTPETEPAHGQLTLAADGSFSYQPDAGFSGQDSFQYRVTDPNQGQAVASVQIDVVQSSMSLKGASLTTSGSLTLEGLGETSSGSGIGQVRYTLGDCVQTTYTECTLSGTYSETSDSEHEPGATGSYTMVYVYDGTGPTPTIAESISPGSNTVIFNEVGESTFTLTLFPDSGGEIVAYFPPGSGSPLSFSAFLATDAVCSGLGVSQACNVGQVGLTPDAVIIGDVASFTFIIDQPVLNNNQPPIANPDQATVQEDGSVNINVLANDSDPDGDSLQVISATAANGSAAIETDFTVTYQPAADFNGQDTINYTIYDGKGNSVSSTVEVTISPVNDAPQPGNIDGLVNNSTTAMFIDVLAVATDIEMDNLTLVSAITSAGSISIVNNLLYFEPGGVAENTQVVIEYVIADGNGGQTTGTLVLFIANNWPNVNPDAYATRPATLLNVDDQQYLSPLFNDIDVNSGDVLTYDLRLTPAKFGTFTDFSTPESGFSYLPFTGSFGIDGSIYQITDGQNEGEGLFTIQVSDIDWDNSVASPNIPVLDFLDLTFDGIDYALFNNDAVVETPTPSQGKYYAVSGRMIISSSDKQIWQTEYATYNGNLTAIASGYTTKNPGVETHIAVGNSSSILMQQRSGSNASHWLELATGIANGFNNIQFDGSRFMAVSKQNVAFSDNGYQWAGVTVNTDTEFRDIIFANDLYVIVGDGGTIETSAEGVSWQLQTSGTVERLNAIAYGNGSFVAVGESGTILSSTDGGSWLSRISGISDHLNQVVWQQSQFVAVGDGSKVLTSPDGISWTQQTSIDTGNIRSVLFDGSELLLGSNNGELFASQDGQSFTPLQQSQDQLTAVASDGGNILVRAGNPALLYRSNDQGQSWSALSALGAMNVNALEYFNGQFIAVGDNGLIMLSTDGANWNTVSSGSSANLQDVFWYSGQDVQGAPFSLYVAVGNNGVILTSQNGTSWALEVSSPASTDDLLAVSHDDDYFVAVGNNGRLLVRNNTATPGATTWMDFFSNTSWGNLHDIYFTGSRCVIVGDNGRVVTGTSQTVFSSSVLSPSLAMFAVDGNSNQVVAAGQDGAVFVSQDGGISWQQALQATEFNLYDLDVQPTGNLIYAVGERGTFIKGTTDIN